ncbi:uncharacterized protein N7482_001504 [Penicillium canariense]|uniref:Uncharacterized protein n=1 Tax=Penicillium canariense TaxID=189055 RepID=A0A9W9IFR1_9EURO|nr:uncharacterized protein N7482_001504 [Penicillium canariense]KAJ5175627.1 hypothetical protein N7482_001504 [Penicillium canariense]
MSHFPFADLTESWLFYLPRRADNTQSAFVEPTLPSNQPTEFVEMNPAKITGSTTAVSNTKILLQNRIAHDETSVPWIYSTTRIINRTRTRRQLVQRAHMFRHETRSIRVGRDGSADGPEAPPRWEKLEGPKVSHQVAKYHQPQKKHKGYHPKPVLHAPPAKALLPRRTLASKPFPSPTGSLASVPHVNSQRTVVAQYTVASSE